MSKQTILEIDINVENLLKRAAEAQKNVESLKEETVFFKKSIKDTKASIEKHNDALYRMYKQGLSNTKEYKERKQTVENLSKTQEKNRQKLELANSTLKNAQNEYRVAQRTINAYNKSLDDQLGIIKKTDGSMNQISAALSENKKIYKSLTKEQRENHAIGGRLNKLIAEQDVEYKKLHKSIGNNQVDVGNYKGQIAELLEENGGLLSSVGELGVQIPIIGGAFSFVSKALSRYVRKQIEAIAATKGAAKGLKILKMALVSTGVGAIIVALGMLVVAFSKSQKAVDYLQEKLAYLTAAFNVIMDAFIGVAEAIVDSFKASSNAMKGLENDISKGSKFMQNIFSILDNTIAVLKNNIKGHFLAMRIAWNEFVGDSEEAEKLKTKLTEVEQQTLKSEKAMSGAYMDIKRAIGEVVSEMEREAKKAMELERRYQKLQRTATIFKAEISQSNREIANKKATAALSEQNGNISEAIELYGKANKELEKMQDKQIALRENELANSLQLDLSIDEDRVKFEKFVKQLREANVDFGNLNKSADLANYLIANIGMDNSVLDDLDDVVDKFKELNNEVASNEDKQRSNAQKITSLQRRQIQEAQKAAEAKKQQLQKEASAEIKKSETVLKKYLLENNVISATLKERFTIYKKAYEDEKNILKQQLEAKQLTQEEYELAIAEKRKEYAEKNAQAAIENANKELELYIAKNQTKLDSEKQLTDKLVAAEIERLQVINDKKNEILEEQRKNGLISEQDYQLQKLQLESEFAQQKKELGDQSKEQKKEAEQTDYENELETKLLRGENEYALRLEVLERDRLAEVAVAEKKGINVDKVNQKYAAKKQKISEAQQKAEIDAVSAGLGSIKQIFGEQTAMGKTAALAETTINTYKAATAAYSAMAKIPVVGPAMGVAAAAAAVAAGLANAKKIAGISTKLEKGGLLRGKSHSQGGIPFAIDGEHGFEAEGGEYIVNKKATSQFLPLLEQINKQYRIGTTAPRFYYQAGGVVSGKLQANSQFRLDYRLLAERIGESVAAANRDLPRPVVAVEDINLAQSDYAEIVSSAEY